MGVAWRWVWKDAWAAARARLRTPPAARRSIQKTVLGSGDSRRKLKVGADVGGALAEAGGLVDVLDVFELAFEAGEGVEGGGVGVAGSLRGMIRAARRACGRGWVGRRGLRRGGS